MDDLVKRLRQYEGRQFETTGCYNGLRDEAANEIVRLNGDNARLRRLNPNLTGYANGYADAMEDAPAPVFTDQDAEIIIEMQRSIIHRLKDNKKALRHMLNECVVQMEINKPKDAGWFLDVQRNAQRVWAQTSDEPLPKPSPIPDSEKQGTGN